MKSVTWDMGLFSERGVKAETGFGERVTCTIMNRIWLVQL